MPRLEGDGVAAAASRGTAGSGSWTVNRLQLHPASTARSSQEAFHQSRSHRSASIPEFETNAHRWKSMQDSLDGKAQANKRNSAGLHLFELTKEIVMNERVNLLKDEWDYKAKLYETSSEGSSRQDAEEPVRGPVQAENLDPEEALDLSWDGFTSFKADLRSYADLFAPLSLLILANSPRSLSCEDLTNILKMAPRLQRLDVARCGLKEVPKPQLWAQMERLHTVFLHQNAVRSWEDITAPLNNKGVIWYTAFANPISVQPEYRRICLQTNPSLLLIDYWIVTDDERLDILPAPPDADEDPVNDPQTGRRRSKTRSVVHARLELESRNRFFSSGKKTEFCTAAYHKRNRHDDEERMLLLQEMVQESWGVRVHSSYCSAACYLQTRWRKTAAKGVMIDLRDVSHKAAKSLQRYVKMFLWRRQMRQYTKEYLAEVDELDLLLSASEMLRNKALRLIRTAVKTWVHNRKMKKMEREASLMITRTARGFLCRRQVLRSKVELSRYRRVYFPEHFAWEVLVLINVVNKRHGLPPLTRAHQFERAEYVGVSMPDIDEFNLCNSSIMSLNRIAMNCIIREKRSDRRPDLAWDGPPLGFVGVFKRQEDEQAFRVIRQRGVNVDNRCRRLFLESCAPSPDHPIDLKDADAGSNDDSSKDPPVESLVLKDLLEGPRSNWPEECRKPNTMMNKFMNEAVLVGSRLRRGPGSRSNATSGRTSIPGKQNLWSYRRTIWTQQRLVYYTCHSETDASDLLCSLLEFGRKVGHLAASHQSIHSVSPCPFLPELLVLRIAAATSIQSAYRAYRERYELPTGVLQMALMRRAALCIQRGWRWGIMKRRLDLLVGALDAVKNVKSASLYIEERMLTAINTLSALDRYPPFIRERALGLGCKNEKADSTIVLTMKNEARQHAMSRNEGLPAWLQAQLGSGQLTVCKPDENSLKQVNGIHGLLLEGIPDPFVEADRLVDVSIPMLVYAAGIESKRPNPPMGLIAGGGKFRFIELRYPSVAHARRRALALFLCTYDAKRHIAVPIISTKAKLKDVSLGWTHLHIWDTYGLSWPEGDRVRPYQLRTKGASEVVDVPICGKHPFGFIMNIGPREDENLKLSLMTKEEIKAAKEARLAEKDQAKMAKDQAKREVKRMESAEATFTRLQDSLEARKEKENHELISAFADKKNSAAQVGINRLYNDESIRGGQSGRPLPLTGLVGRIPPTTDERAAHPEDVVTTNYGEKLRELIDCEHQADLAKKRQSRQEVRDSKLRARATITGFNEVRLSNARKWASNHRPSTKAPKEFQVPFSHNWATVFEQIIRRALQNATGPETITVHDKYGLEVSFVWNGRGSPQLIPVPDEDAFPLTVRSKGDALVGKAKDLALDEEEDEEASESDGSEPSQQPSLSLLPSMDRSRRAGFRASVYPSSVESADSEDLKLRAVLRASRQAEKALVKQGQDFLKKVKSFNHTVALADGLERRMAQEEELRMARLEAQAAASLRTSQRKQQERNGLHFKQRLASINRVVAQQDLSTLQHARTLATERDLDRKREIWDRHAVLMAERHKQCLKQRRVEVDQLKAELHYLNGERQRQEEENLARMKSSIAEQKSWDKFLREMRGKLQDPSTVSPSLPTKPQNSKGDAVPDLRKFHKLDPVMPVAKDDAQSKTTVGPDVGGGDGNFEDPQSTISVSPWFVTEGSEDYAPGNMTADPLPLKPSYPAGPAIHFPSCHKPQPPPPIAPGVLLVKPPTARGGSRRSRSARGPSGAAVAGDAGAAAAAEPWLQRLGGHAPLTAR